MKCGQMAIPISFVVKWPFLFLWWLGGHSYSWLPQYYCIPYQQLHMHLAKTTLLKVLENSYTCVLLKSLIVMHNGHPVDCVPEWHS